MLQFDVRITVHEAIDDDLRHDTQFDWDQTLADSLKNTLEKRICDTVLSGKEYHHRLFEFHISGIEQVS